MMKMYFHYGYENQFLFHSLAIDSPFKMWLLCAGLFSISIVFEFIKYVRCVRCGCSPSQPLGGDNNEPNVRLAHNCYVGHLRSRRHRLIQTVLHTMQTAIGFMLMLSVMSFNLCIIFAILVGTGAGYYIFYRPYNEVEAIDSCH